MATGLDGKSSVNVKRLVMWTLKTDTEEGTTYEEAPRVFLHQMNSVRYSPKVETAQQYGDGIKVEDYVAKDGGDDEIVIRGFTSGDSEFLFGETETEDGVSISGANDIVPYVAAAWMTERPDGKLNLYKQFKVKFMPQGEDNKQREGTTIQYATATLRGTYSPRLSDGKDMAKRYGVDENTDKDFIAKWFSQADFIGENAAKPSSSANSETKTSVPVPAPTKSGGNAE